jgi:hypothetical protein
LALQQIKSHYTGLNLKVLLVGNEKIFICMVLLNQQQEIVFFGSFLTWAEFAAIVQGCQEAKNLPGVPNVELTGCRLTDCLSL